MWLVTTQGFYSVVEHRDDPDTLIVRCRVREDMEALREQIPTLEVFSDRSADYRWRAHVPRREWLAAMLEMGDGIDYDNFKDAVKARQGQARADVYLRVWMALQELQFGWDWRRPVGSLFSRR